MIRLTGIILLLIGFSPANAEIYINQKHGVFLPPVSTQVAAGQLKWIPLSKANASQNEQEQFEVNISVSGLFTDIKAYICDEPNLKLINNGQDFRCFTGEGKGNFILTGSRYSNAQHYLVFDNRHSLLTPKNVFANVYASFNIDGKSKQEFESNFTNIISSLHELFITPDFDVTVAPCKQENAFSVHDGGHITMCSELIYGTLLDGNRGAFMGVFLHELGHTLLNVWDQPHYTNEKTADEFAIAILLMDEKRQGEQIIYDYIEYFKNDNYLEGQIMGALSGGQHPLNIQRINNIEGILGNRGEFLRRWANVLYPHMTEQALQNIIDNPYTGANSELAKEILNSRRN